MKSALAGTGMALALATPLQAKEPVYVTVGGIERLAKDTRLSCRDRELVIGRGDIVYGTGVPRSVVLELQYACERPTVRQMLGLLADGGYDVTVTGDDPYGTEARSLDHYLDERVGVVVLSGDERPRFNIAFTRSLDPGGTADQIRRDPSGEILWSSMRVPVDIGWRRLPELTYTHDFSHVRLVVGQGHLP